MMFSLISFPYTPCKETKNIYQKLLRDMNPLLEYASGLEKVVQNEPEIRLLKPELALPNYVIVLLKKRLEQVKAFMMMEVERNG